MIRWVSEWKGFDLCIIPYAPEGLSTSFFMGLSFSSIRDSFLPPLGKSHFLEEGTLMDDMFHYCTMYHVEMMYHDPR